jgi:hypothetical protein
MSNIAFAKLEKSFGAPVGLEKWIHQVFIRLARKMAGV